jgi:diguanylate cyclase (GGDEF)-like protein
MRLSVVATIAAIGLFALVFVLVSGHVYRNQTLAERSVALADNLRQGWFASRRDAEGEAAFIARRLMADPGWQHAWARNDVAALVEVLEALREGHITVERLALLDDQYRLVAVTRGIGGAGISCSLPGSAARAANAVCVERDSAWHVLRTPLAPLGYLEVVAAVAPGLKRLEAALGSPLRLADENGAALFESPSWTALASESDVVRARFALPAHVPTRAALTLEGLHDARALVAQLSQVQTLMLVVAALILAVLGFGSLVLVERTALSPLRTLTERLRAIRQDRSQLGVPVRASGTAEVAELAAGFNEMTLRLKELYASLEHMAFTDALTGLPNRLLFQDRLQQLILAARRENKSFALFIMDLDHFKDINDTLGHHVGDLVLKEVAGRLRTKLRESDTVARMGGDEFAVLLPTAGGKHATMAARMLLQALRVPFEIEDQSLDVGASIGIALYPDHGLDANVLVQRADVAMYAAKNTGTGHAFYDTRLDQHSSARLALMSDLRRAVQQEQFELHYQPKIDLGTGRVMGVEALVRWRHPRDGLLLPDNFIQLLEQTGLIRSLTPWVINEAMSMSRRLQEQGVLVTVSVNLSVKDLQDPYLTDTLREQLANHGIDPSMIEFEITESAVMTEPERGVEALARLAEMGFRLAIDDFGTGYSSFSYLKKMPVSTLKVDKSFVLGAARDENDAAIVRTSIALAHNLNMKIVAEGVEDELTLERLRQLGCDAAQGNFMSRALTSEELVEWLRHSSWGLRDTPVKLSLV